MVVNRVEDYKIRPAGRHLLTIGEDLIQDKFAALVELVKNAYDADSKDVVITFGSNQKRDKLFLKISDHGHGMSREDVINKWLVPSTDYKVRNRKSPRGRIMQGRKGIGRYAASILGDDLFLETVDINGEKTSLYIDWSQFSKSQYLDQVSVLVESEMTQQKPGTTIIVQGSQEYLDEWSENQFKKLRFELKKLIPPEAENVFDDSFEILLKFHEFYSNQSEDLQEEISPYPILDLYDYRISGTLDANGIGVFSYSNNKIRNVSTDIINVNYGSTLCGKLVIDIRVYDRDKDAIEQLINRGLKDEITGDYVSKLEARQLLNEVNGIGVYRNGFRIRPLGDADFDWLKLNEQRVQKPSVKIGSNQVVGYVHIESEEVSNLEEKSARDGLKDNIAYEQLKDLTCKIISELEARRFIYRRKIGLSGPGKKIDKELEGLYDYDPLKKSVSSSLKKAGLSETIIAEIEEIISKEEKQKNQAIEEIRQAVAVYQGQATLGKIINIILHEGRRPLNYFKNQIPNMKFQIEKYHKNQEIETADKISDFAIGIQENADIFVNLFGRLDPLAAKKRDTKKKFILDKIISGVVSVFENELTVNGIKIDITGEKKVGFDGWQQDFYTIFTNLIDNSIYWIEEKNLPEKSININISMQDGSWQIDYRDSGPGIDAELLENGVIFEPEFSTKLNGTGLGLSIAGEAAQRNNLILIALQNDKGAHFKISPEEER